MKREDVLRTLRDHREKLRRFRVASLWIFGSVARDDATDASDIDVLVEFEEGQRVGLFTFIRLMHYLEDLLGAKVDLATPGALRPEMRDEVLGEAIRAT